MDGLGGDCDWRFVLVADTLRYSSAKNIAHRQDPLSICDRSKRLLERIRGTVLCT